METIKHLVCEEMRVRGVKCAVIGIVYRDREEYAKEIKDVMFFEDYSDFRDWWKTLDSLFEPSERPVHAWIIYNV